MMSNGNVRRIDEYRSFIIQNGRSAELSLPLNGQPKRDYES
jgi:hypothetical protein